MLSIQTKNGTLGPFALNLHKTTIPHMVTRSHRLVSFGRSGCLSHKDHMNANKSANRSDEYKLYNLYKINNV